MSFSLQGKGMQKEEVKKYLEKRRNMALEYRWSREKANRVLPRECTGHSKHPLPATQEKTLHMDITRWSIPKSDWLYSLQPEMQNSALYSQQKQDRELTVTQIMNSLLSNSDLNWRKYGKPFRYDLNQIPYDYTVEVTNRFKRLDLIECLKNYGWRFVTLYRRQWSRPFPRKRNGKRQNGCLTRPYKQLWKEMKGKGEK